MRDFVIMLVFVCYNMGCVIFENGQVFVELIEQFVVVYFVLLKKIIFIGYSMGGFVLCVVVVNVY